MNYTDRKLIKLSYWQLALPFYKISLPLLGAGALASYFDYDFTAATAVLTAALLTCYTPAIHEKSLAERWKEEGSS